METIEIIRKVEETQEKVSTSRPLKGILKREAAKSAENREESRKQAEKMQEIDPKSLQKLLKLIENKEQSANVRDELEKFIKELKNSGQNTQKILENIKVLKTFMVSQQQLQKRAAFPSNNNNFTGKVAINPAGDQRQFIRKTSFKNYNKFRIFSCLA